MDALATLTCGSCGQKNRATDRFCNHCGLPLAAPRAAELAIPPAPPAAQAPASKCVVGHPIAPGAHFCAHGHPIALDSLHLTRGGLSSSPTPVPPPPATYGSAQVIATPASPMAAFGGAPPLAPVVPVPPPLDANAYVSPTARAQREAAAAHAAVVAAPPVQVAAPPAAIAPAPPLVPAAPPAAPVQTSPAQAPREHRVLRGFLVPLQGRPTQEYWALHGMVVTVGRANTGDNVDVAVLDSTTSSRHASVHFDPSRGIVYVEDLGSTNGTFVNDVPIGHNGRRELRDNDRVRFGGFSALLKLLPLL
jgi:hypothetical protein